MPDSSGERPELKQISRYRFLRKLGVGGMGDVYLAEDELLQRKVAVKVLHACTGDESMRRRLLNEARAASVLDHPHICAVHEVGEDQGFSFLVMQYIEGTTLAVYLREHPPGLMESLDIAAQIADALAEAHARGIVHRDIKPQNVMVTAGPRVKVLDFGLAKRLPIPGSDGAQSETPSLDSQPGSLAGTLEYMSPEQTRGGPVDPRADIFSFGILLYQMLSGHHPFKGATVSETLASIQLLDPPPLAKMARVPPKLEWIVDKCLMKDRERRYSSALDLKLDLENLRRELSGESEPVAVENVRRRSALYALVLLVIAVAAVFAWRQFGANSAAPESIAVLPFINDTGTPEGEVYCRGIAERLTGVLSRNANLRVKIPPPGAGPSDPLKTGRALGAAAVLYGKMSQNRDRCVFWAGLLNTRDNTLRPAATFDIEHGDVVAVQVGLVSQILEMFHLQLSDEQRQSMRKREPVSDQAWSSYLNGLKALQARTSSGYNEAIEAFRQTISYDPKYAPAYAGLASAYALKACPGECVDAARANARIALQLDSALGEAHAARGFILSHYEWKWREAEEEFKKALQGNPNYASGYHWYADLLLAKGRFNEAAESLRRAYDIDPQAAIIRADFSLPFYYGGNPDLSVQESRAAVSDYPDAWFTHLFLARALLLKKDYQGAIVALEDAWKLTAGAQNMPAYEVYAYGRWGRRDKAMEAFQSLEKQARGTNPLPYHFAIAYIGLGERDKALEYLEKGVQQKDPYMMYLGVDPLLDSLRSDSRFIKLVARVREGM